MVFAATGADECIDHALRSTIPIVYKEGVGAVIKRKLKQNKGRFAISAYKLSSAVMRKYANQRAKVLKKSQLLFKQKRARRSILHRVFFKDERNFIGDSDSFKNGVFIETIARDPLP